MLGLMLTGSFLWGCYYLRFKMGIKILYADVSLAIFYVIAAYILAQTVEVSFWTMFTVFLVVWLALMVLFSRMTFEYHAQQPTKTKLWLKAATVFTIAFALFSAHQYLAAFVVTFPYNGVFAVYENKTGLLPQAALFTRNCLALAAYFLANYLAGVHYPAVVRYALSWLAFGVVLLAVNRLINIRVKDVSPATT
jgi:hypothetical protein